MRKIISISVTVAIMAAIFIFSAQTGSSSSSLSLRVTETAAKILFDDYNSMPSEIREAIIRGLHGFIRKLAHFSVYLALGASVFTSASFYVRPNRRRFLIAFIISAAYAATDEIHQLFVAGRAGMASDFLIDTAGAVVGCLLALCVFFFKKDTTRI